MGSDGTRDGAAQLGVDVDNRPPEANEVGAGESAALISLRVARLPPRHR
jgi:hypothetical protein